MVVTEDYGTEQIQQRGIAPGMILIAITSLAGVAIALSIILVDARATTDEAPTIVEQRPPLAIGDLAPDFVLDDLAGDPLRLSDLRGRVVFLNFWATWCIPCRREMPAFEEFMAGQTTDGPLVLAVNDGETTEQIQAFFAEINVSGIPVALDRESTVRAAYSIFAMPTTYVIDEMGVIRAVKFGEVTLEDFASYLAQIDEAST